jgi:hypothetical protein
MIAAANSVFNGGSEIAAFPDKALLAQRYDEPKWRKRFDYTLLSPLQQEYMLRPEISEHTWPEQRFRRSITLSSIDDIDTPLFESSFVPFLFDSYYTTHYSRTMSNEEYMMHRLKSYVDNDMVSSYHIKSGRELLIELNDDTIVGVKFSTGWLYDDFHP